LFVCLFVCLFVSLFLAREPPIGPGPPHSRGFYITHTDTPQSVGLLWTSDQLVAENSTWQHSTLTTDIHAPGGIRTHNLSRRTAADPRFRQRCNWNQFRRMYVAHKVDCNSRNPNYQCSLFSKKNPIIEIFLHFLMARHPNLSG
jgi:hypothetical protein